MTLDEAGRLAAVREQVAEALAPFPDDLLAEYGITRAPASEGPEDCEQWLAQATDGLRLMISWHEPGKARQ
jgi:hypothetical protein